MNATNQFLAYAAAFEETYEDDDWERIKPFFSSDVVYLVESEVFGARLVGPDAVAAGIKKSLDGFDRRFTERKLEATGPPKAEGDEFEIGWRAHYLRDGVEPLVVNGSSAVRVRDGKIYEMIDRYDAEADRELRAWQARNAFAIDPSYR